MTIDFEQQLRQDLRAAAGRATDVPLDLASAISEGRTVVRRRTIGWTVMLALPLIAGAAIALGSLNTTVGIPEPVAPTSTAPAGTTFTLDRNVRLDRPWTDNDPATITVEAERLPGEAEFRLRYWTVDVDGNRGPVAGSEIASGRATWGTGSTLDGYVVGVVPGDARTILALPAAGGSSTGDQRVLPGTGLTAFYWRFENPAEAERVAALLWIDADGGVHDSASGTVPSAKLGSGEHTVIAFVDRALDVVGANRGGSTHTSPLSATEGKVTKAGGWTSEDNFGYVVGLLPAGSTEVRATFRQGVTEQVLDVAPSVGPERDVIFLASGTYRTIPILLEVSWRDASGKRFTVDASR